MVHTHFGQIVQQVHLPEKLSNTVKDGDLISACKAVEQYNIIKPQNLVLKRLLQCYFGDNKLQ